MSHFIFQKEDNSDIKFGIARKPPENIVDHVPAGIYIPDYMPTPFGPELIGLKYIEDSFKVESEVRYGVFNDVKDTILKEYKKKKVGSTSVLAIGEPGTGKTLMGKDLANYCIRLGMPVLFIRQEYPITDIERIAKIISPCMVFLDEFGKFYETSRKDSDGDVVGSTASHGHLLSMLDNRDLSNVLFYLSSNTDDKSNDLGIINRPGRVQFKINMKYLEASSLVDCIYQSPISEKMKELLYLNVFDQDLNVINKGWSTDIVNYVSQYLTHDFTQAELNIFSAIHNVPNMSLRTLRPFELAKRVKLFEAQNPGFDTSQVKHITFTNQPNQILSTITFNNGKSIKYHCIYDIYAIVVKGMEWGFGKPGGGFILTFVPVKENPKHNNFQMSYANSSILEFNTEGDKTVLDFAKHREHGVAEKEKDSTDDSSISHPAPYPMIIMEDAATSKRFNQIIGRGRRD